MSPALFMRVSLQPVRTECKCFFLTHVTFFYFTPSRTDAKLSHMRQTASPGKMTGGSIRLAETEWDQIRAYQKALADKSRTNVSMNDAITSLLRLGLKESGRTR